MLVGSVGDIPCVGQCVLDMVGPGRCGVCMLWCYHGIFASVVGDWGQGVVGCWNGDGVMGKVGKNMLGLVRQVWQGGGRYGCSSPCF